MSSAVILATAGYDHKIRFWEAPTGVCSRSLRYPDSQVNCLQITPDKQFIAAAGNPHVRLFEVGGNANPNPVVSYDGHTGNVMALGFQRDAKWMYTCSEDGTIKLWDLRAPGCQRSYDNTASPHPLAASGSATATTIPTTTTTTTNNNSSGPTAAAASTAAAYYHQPHQPGQHVAVNSVVLHPNQAELIIGDQDGRVRVWDLTNDQCVQEARPEGIVPVRSVSVASDASLIAAGNNEANLHLFRPEASKELAPVHSFKAHGRYLLKCAFSPDSQRLVTTSADKTARLWRVGGKWDCEQVLKDHQRWVWDAVFSADSSYLVTACSDHHPRLWDLRTGDLVRTYQGHNLAVTCVALNDAAS